MSERGYCTSCGARLEPGNAFCSSCGAPAEAGTRATDRSTAGAAPSVAFPSGRGAAFGAFTRRIRAFFKLSGVAWGSAAVGLLMVLLVALFPLVSPAVGLAYPMVLRVPLLLFAAGALGWLIDEGGREGRRRRGFGWLALIALAVYLFAAAYRLLLGVFGFVEGSAPVWLLVLVAGCGLACAAFGVRNRGGGDATPERPSLFGGGWRHALAGVARWVKASPRGVAAAVVAGALGALGLFSPYLLVLGAVSVVVGVVALIVRAARRAPLKQAGTVALAALALTLASGFVSDALYNTGTGLVADIGHGSGADTASGDGGDYAEQAARDARNTERLANVVFEPDPYGAVDKQLIDDLWVNGDTAEVVLVPMEDPFSVEIEGAVICQDVARLASVQDVPVDEVRVVMGPRLEELETCGVPEE